VNDIASEVGLGWVLNARGMIYRAVFQKPDEKWTNKKRTFNSARELLDSVKAAAPIWEPSSTSLIGCMNLEEFLSHSGSFQNEDPMTDRFFYRLPTGTSGVFRHDFLSDTIMKLPYRPLRIEEFISSSAGVGTILDSLKITDKNGTI